MCDLNGGYSLELKSSQNLLAEVINSSIFKNGIIGDNTMKVLNFINGFNPQMNSKLNVRVIKMTHYVKVLTYLKPHDLRRPTWWKQK